MISSHVVGDGFKPLPDRLEITFFSYTENVFYQGAFDLPYGKILELFNAGYFSQRENGHATYDNIMCGIAPGGTVVVWLLGIDKITEVFTGKANKIEASEKLNEIIPPELVKMEIENEDSKERDALESMRKNGIPFTNWSTRFRTQYQWVPAFAVENPPKKISAIFYLNGEQDYLIYPLNDSIAAATRPVPKQMNFVYQSPKGWSYLYNIHFDEAEALKVFERLGANQQKLKLEFDLQMPINLTQVRLRNEKKMSS